jgi:branched-chain amino acid transport system substrate-binding protein
MVAAAALIAAGCGSDDSNDSNSSSDKGGKFDGSMKVGAIVPLTGDLQQYGETGNIALEMAEKVANDALADAGYDGKVELLVEDGETKEDAAKSAAEKLAGEDVSCIVGDWASSSTLAVAQSVTIDEGIPLISPASTAGELTTLEDDGLVFRTVPSDNLQASVLADAIAEDIGDGGKVTVAARNNAYGTGLAAAFQEAGDEAGLEVSEPILMDPDSPQAKSEAADITAEDADAYLLIDYPDAFLKLGPELVKTGKWDPAKTWGSDGLRSEDLPKTGNEKFTEGMRGTAPTSAEAPAAEAFDKLWHEDSKRPERQTYDSDNFDAFLACVLAAVAADSADPSDVADALTDVSGGGTKYTFEELTDAIKAAADGEDIDYEGAASPLDWDENGDPAAAFYEIWDYKDGKLGTLETIPFGASDDSGDSTDTTSTDETDTTGTTEAEPGDSTETEPTDTTADGSGGDQMTG